MTAPLKARDLLVRGMLAGLVAGVCALAFAAVFGAPEVDKAIAFEEANAEAQPHSHAEGEEASPVSRDTQKTFGLATGIGVFGIAIGGVFSLVFAVTQGRIGRFRPRETAAILAAAAFVTVSLVPWITFPANPPAVGDAETVEKRAALFVATIAISIAAAIAATRAGRALSRRFGAWNAAIAGGLVFIVIVGGIQLLLPSVEAVPAGFPGDVLWRFRLASLGTHFVMWAALGVVFGALVERSLQPAKLPAASAAPRSTA